MSEALPSNPFIGVNMPPHHHPISFDFNHKVEPLYWKEIQRPGIMGSRETVGMEPQLFRPSYLPPVAYSKQRSLFDIVDFHEERVDPKSLEHVDSTILMRPRLIIDEHVFKLAKQRDLLVTLAQLMKQAELSVTNSGLQLVDPYNNRELWSLSRVEGVGMVSSIPVVNGDPFLMLKLGEIAHIEENPNGRKFIAAPMYDSTMDPDRKFAPYHVTATYMISYSPSILSTDNYDSLITPHLSKARYEGKDLHSKIDPFIEISFGE